MWKWPHQALQEILVRSTGRVSTVVHSSKAISKLRHFNSSAPECWLISDRSAVSSHKLYFAQKICIALGYTPFQGQPTSNDWWIFGLNLGQLWRAIPAPDFPVWLTLTCSNCITAQLLPLLNPASFIFSVMLPKASHRKLLKANPHVRVCSWETWPKTMAFLCNILAFEWAVHSHVQKCKAIKGMQWSLPIPAPVIIYFCTGNQCFQ